MRILGIDPGKKGAWCLLDTADDNAWLSRLQWNDDNILVADQFPEFDHLFIEKIKPIPGKMGVQSSFTMGLLYGQLLGFASLHPHTLLTPQSWQKVCLEGIDTDLDSKLRSRIGWVRLNPTQETITDDNFTDAFHIACYGMHKWGLGTRRWLWQRLPATSKRSKK